MADNVLTLVQPSPVYQSREADILKGMERIRELVDHLDENVSLQAAIGLVRLALIMPETKGKSAVERIREESRRKVVETNGSG